MPSLAEPITDTEAEALLAPFARARFILLAISGGLDSTALMYLATRWRELRPGAPRLVAATVDHGLRPESVSEAAAVTSAARSLGLEHRTLQWLGPKPTSALQERARAARYRLLGDLALSLGREQSLRADDIAIATAHTADDQAETVVMRLARGSGLDGLSGMAPDSPLGALAGMPEAGPIRLLRPLLGTPRARLQATLAHDGVSHIEDPSNSDQKFERVRVRQALSTLAAIGLDTTGIARSATRLQRAREALEIATDALQLAACTRRLEAVLAIDLASFAPAPAEIGIRLLRRALLSTGGLAPMAEYDAVEDAYARLAKPAAPPVSFTLGGCIVDPECEAGTVLIYREPDRPPGLEILTLRPGTRAVWDGRFVCSIASDFPEAEVSVGALGGDWALLKAAHPFLSSCPIPARAARGLPAFRYGKEGKSIAVPALADWALQSGDVGTSAALGGPISAASEQTGSQSVQMLSARLRNNHR
ncbi:MAG: tRNA lysidine(34) synthetase TilS [Proteobacteria bacterium]|nr:tRNA lysidine(34) synthetase TilS [Pseudomonadota bacterium]